MTKKTGLTKKTGTLLFNLSCLGLKGVRDDSVDAVVTDPPYGISFKNNAWDKALPDSRIWQDCLRVLKPGGYGVVFSAIRLMHRLMVSLEDSGFVIRDVLFWAYLNGMPKSSNVGLKIDKVLGKKSRKVGEYNYVQGYRTRRPTDYRAEKNKPKLEPVSAEGRKHKGSGMGLKPAYEPIVLVQKPLEPGLSVAENIIRYGTGVLNIEDTRLPYGPGEKKVGHNPHPRGRVAANVVRTEPFGDGYDKFFLVPKVRQQKEQFNHHPTLKPVHLMEHLVRLVSFDGQTVLDPFMGSGSTGVAAIKLKRMFVGYEADKSYFEVAEKRLDVSQK